LAVIKRAAGVEHQFGGEEHSGWLPPGAATPLPTPVRRVTLDVAIEETEGPGYLLILTAREDNSVGNDWWFDTLAQAEEAGLEWFGIGPSDWQEP
jgi:hypothetical protein